MKNTEYISIKCYPQGVSKIVYICAAIHKMGGLSIGRPNSYFIKWVMSYAVEDPFYSFYPFVIICEMDLGIRRPLFVCCFFSGV